MCQGVDLESPGRSQGLLPSLAQGASFAAPVARERDGEGWTLDVGCCMHAVLLSSEALGKHWLLKGSRNRLEK